MKKYVKITILTLTLLAMLLLPSLQIVKAESILQHGDVYLLPIKGYDPSDLFRGRYIMIQLKMNHLDYALNEPHPEFPDYCYNERAYLTLKVNSDGMAEPDQLFLEPPSGQNYLKVRLSAPLQTLYENTSTEDKDPMWGAPVPWGMMGDNAPNDNAIKLGYRIYFALDTDRWYLNEKKAPELEEMLRKEENVVALQIRLKGDAMVPESLQLNGKTITLW